MKMVDNAYKARADAVKFQVFNPGEVVNPEVTVSAEGAKGVPRKLVDILSGLALTDNEIERLKTHCDSRGITFLATPFDLQHVELLSSLDVVAFKIGSGDVTNIPMIEAISKTGTPIILSTGMSMVEEIDEAVETIGEYRTQLALLHCVSEYPASHEGLRLRTIGALRRRYSVPVGFSDHTLGSEASIAAVALGACIIEKHFTLDRKLPGADHAMSTSPTELRTLIKSVRNIERSLEGNRIGLSTSEAEIRVAARRSIVARVRIRKGQRIKAEMLAVRRPANGLHPRYLQRIVGTWAVRDIPANAPLSEDDLP
jgi:N,N'-diacetyllegionaminate synthase